MVARAPTYTVTSAEAFRKKGHSLSYKLHDEFAQIGNSFSTGMQVTAGTLKSNPHVFGGYIFTFTNPIDPTPIIVDHIVMRITTAGGTANAVCDLGRATVAGVSRALTGSQNSAPEGGASRLEIAQNWLLNYASVYSTISMQGSKMGGTILFWKFPYINCRGKSQAFATLAGTYYVYWHKALAGS
jgi:hypothetical protein